jgi:hypothetical protein
VKFIALRFAHDNLLRKLPEVRLDLLQNFGYQGTSTSLRNLAAEHSFA